MISLYERQLLNDLAREFTAQVKDALRNKPIERVSKRKGSFSSPVNASGNLIDSVRITQQTEGIEVLCASYIDSLIYGMPPNTIKTSIYDIELWLAHKGLDYWPASVYANLEKYGNSIYQRWEGKNSGLLSDVDITKRIEEVKSKLSKVHIEEIVNIIREAA